MGIFILFFILSFLLWFSVFFHFYVFFSVIVGGSACVFKGMFKVGVFFGFTCVRDFRSTTLIMPVVTPLATRVTGVRSGRSIQATRSIGDRAVAFWDANSIALGRNLHHRIEGGVVLLCGVEGEGSSHTAFGASHEELLEALLADQFMVQGGRGGRK